MKACALIDEAGFGPETAKAMGAVFDQASERINRIFDNQPDAAEAARIRLAARSRQQGKGPNVSS
jgi:hypothetical protein